MLEKKRLQEEVNDFYMQTSQALTAARRGLEEKVVCKYDRVGFIARVLSYLSKIVAPFVWSKGAYALGVPAFPLRRGVQYSAFCPQEEVKRHH